MTNFVGIDPAAMCFELAGQTSGPDPGAVVIGLIFQDTTMVFSDVMPTTNVQVHASAVPAEAMAFGRNSTSENLRLVDPANGDFRLCPGSPERDSKTPITLTELVNGSYTVAERGRRRHPGPCVQLRGPRRRLCGRPVRGFRALQFGGARGDWNDDGDFNSSDPVLAFQTGAYERGRGA